MKISIATPSGFKASPVIREFQIDGIPFAVTPSLSRPGRYAATHTGTGLAVLSRAPSIAACIRDACFLVRAHRESFNYQVAAHPEAPPVEGLPDAALPAKPAPAPPVDLDRLVEIIAERAPADLPRDLVLSGIRSALSSRTGRLKSKAPADAWGKAAWNGIQPNAWKIQFSACFLPAGPAALLTALSRATWPAELDKDLATLRSLGVA